MKRILVVIFLLISATINAQNKHFNGSEVIVDSIHANTDPYVADSITFFGTSISFGTGATSNAYRWTTVLTNRLNALEANYAVSGSSGQVDFLNLGWKIHAADRFHRWFVIEYAVNDIINSGNVGTWDTAHYGPILRARVDSLISFYGYLASQIVLLSPSYINPASYANATLARQAQYFAMIQSVATTRGCKFVDVYNPEITQGGALLMQDGALHPQNIGHKLMADRAAAVMKDSVKEQAQVLAINGQAEFQQIKFRGGDTTSDKDAPLLVDSSGRVKRGGNLFAINSYFLKQPQPIGLNIMGQANFGYTPTSLPPSGTVDVIQANGAITGGVIRATTGTPGGFVAGGAVLYHSGTTGGLFDQAVGGATQDFTINPFGARLIIGGTTPANSTATVTVAGPLYANGSIATSAFGFTSGTGVATAFTGGVGYIKAYDFGGSAVKPLCINYQGGAVLISKNTDDGLGAILQINGKESITADSVTTATGGFVFRDATTGILKLTAAPSGGGGSDSAVINGYGILKSVSGTTITLSADTTTLKPIFAASGGGVTTISNSDGTLTISPTSGASVASIALGHANTWTGVQTFNPTLTASSGAATGHIITGTYTAAANSDNLYALKISPSFVNGAFTTVNDGGLWISAGVLRADGGLMVTGSTPNGGSKNTMILNTGSNGYIDEYNGSGTAIPMLLNTLSAGAISLGGDVTVTGSHSFTIGGFLAAKGGLSTNNSALDLGFSANIGYIVPYGSSGTVPLSLQYTGGSNVMIGTNVDNSTGALQILRTTTQLSLLYNSTNHAEFTVGSGGSLGLTGLTGLTVNSSALPTGTTTDSVLVETTSSNVATIKKVAQSSIGGGGGGVTTVGTFSGSSQTNGASIASTTITFGPADATNPGMVTTGSQTFAGVKTHSNTIISSGGFYNSVPGSQIAGQASTINNAITAASGTVSNFSAYAFLAPTVTSTNASISYNNPATLRIDNSPTFSTNSTATGRSYALDVAAGASHFGVGSSNFSAIFDGVVALNGAGGSNNYGVDFGANTTSTSSFHLVSSSGVDVTSPFSGQGWYNGTNFYFADANAIKRDILTGLNNYQHTIFTPSTGGTVALVLNQYNIINPSGALATLTVNLPSSPRNNDVVYIKFTQAVTAVTYGNGTIVDGITAPTAGGLTILTYDAGNNSWY